MTFRVNGPIRTGGPRTVWLQPVFLRATTAPIMQVFLPRSIRPAKKSGYLVYRWPITVRWSARHNGLPFGMARAITSSGRRLLPRSHCSRWSRQRCPWITPDYHPNYYGAFVIDPEGNNIELCAICLNNSKGCIERNQLFEPSRVPLCARFYSPSPEAIVYS